ncbi:OLC1v1025104C1 [Oldenlandia corymbosa var. corymbosa]|uniref:OLC1v1025104C1 n=1 Tax=Oldenlandia corymbosa var. corymbosa TaxID=529605 RepID=A0AAV1C7A9_OLDCO|nr:OLC1v1025104C1 [Oldenlandia corymbosa var. corymbosa]
MKMKLLEIPTINGSEYVSGGLISRRCDIYSYGIMLMEVFTRKKPSNEMFTGDFNLKTWVNNAMSADSILGVIDTNLLTRTEEMENHEGVVMCFPNHRGIFMCFRIA